MGNNGAGKTNLLDAIHYLCLCKSYFNPIDSQQIKAGEELFLVQGDFVRDEKPEKNFMRLKEEPKEIFQAQQKRV